MILTILLSVAVAVALNIEYAPVHVPLKTMPLAEDNHTMTLHQCIREYWQGYYAITKFADFERQGSVESVIYIAWLNNTKLSDDQIAAYGQNISDCYDNGQHQVKVMPMSQVYAWLGDEDDSESEQEMYAITASCLKTNNATSGQFKRGIGDIQGGNGPPNTRNRTPRNVNLNIDVYSYRNFNGQHAQQTQPLNSKCGPFRRQSAFRSFQLDNKAGYEVDMLFWPHHECRSYSKNGNADSHGVGIGAAVGANGRLNIGRQNILSFWIQQDAAQGFPSLDTGATKQWPVQWYNPPWLN